VQIPTGGRGHVVICGHGRVGSIVAGSLRTRGFRYVVIEENRRLAETLRDAGENVVYGSAVHPLVLRRAGIERARTLVMAVPDPIVARLVVERARGLNPRLDIVARASAPAEALALRRLGAAEAVVPEHELALELTRHTLHRVGLSTLETQAIIQALRQSV
jgi:CPA2 family monovalent cation:H+ antiporter-2